MFSTFLSFKRKEKVFRVSTKLQKHESKFGWENKKCCGNTSRQQGTFSITLFALDFYHRIGDEGATRVNYLA